MAASAELHAHIEDLFAPLGAVRVRRFFGYHGLFAGEVMFGLLAGERIYLKTDAKTAKAYVRAACGPFTFRKHTGENIVTSYFALPERLLDEPEELVEWARLAYDIAASSPTAERRRARAAKRKRPKRSP